MLLGRTAGLRPAMVRRLERLSHRRHPESSGADLLSLQRLLQNLSLVYQLPALLAVLLPILLCLLAGALLLRRR